MGFQSPNGPQFNSNHDDSASGSSSSYTHGQARSSGAANPLRQSLHPGSAPNHRGLRSSFMNDQPQLTQTGASRWMIPYADFITVLLGVSFLMYGASVVFPTAQSGESQTPVKEELVAETEASEPEAFSLLSFISDESDEDVEEEAVPIEQKQAPPSTTYPEAPSNIPLGQGEDAQSIEDMLTETLGLDGQQVTVKDDPRGLVISFQDRLFFPSGSSELSKSSSKTLAKLASVLKQSDNQIVVEGHTDNSPIQTKQFPSNWELSMARSTTIVRELIHTHHFDPERLSAAGYGEYKPLADNSTIEGKQKNRRVDIVLIASRKLSSN